MSSVRRSIALFLAGSLCLPLAAQATDDTCHAGRPTAAVITHTLPGRVTVSQVAAAEAALSAVSRQSGHLEATRAALLTAVLTRAALTSRLPFAFVIGGPRVRPTGAAGSIADVNGDGLDDVVDLRYGGPHTVHSITMRSGRNAATLWSRHNDDERLLDYARLGPNRLPALLTVRTGGTVEDTPVGGVGALNLMFVAVDARTGKDLWTTSFRGLEAGLPGGYGQVALPYYDGILDGGKRSDDLLFSVTHSLSTVGGGAEIAQPYVVAGGTGVSSVSGNPIPSDGGSYETPLGDLNGDGTADYGVVAGGDVSSVSARSGRTGAPLWVKTSTVAFGALAPLPDATGDHLPDALLFGVSSGSVQDETVSLIEGSTGTNKWSKSAGFGVAAGDLEHNGKTDVLLLGFTQVLLVSATGRTIWIQTLPVPTSNGGGGGGFFFVGIALFTPRDIDGDGVPDAIVGIDSAGTGRPSTTSTIVYSGRTGTRRITSGIGSPVPGALDGRGADFVKTSADGGRLTVTVTDGAPFRRLWQHSITLADLAGVYFLDTGALTSHRHDDLLLSAYGAQTGYTVAYDGRTGRVLWQLAYQP